MPDIGLIPVADFPGFLILDILLHHSKHELLFSQYFLIALKCLTCMWRQERQHTNPYGRRSGQGPFVGALHACEDRKDNTPTHMVGALDKDLL